MRFKYLGAIATVLLVAASGVHAQQQFTVFASIVDVTGAPAASLQPGDLHVTENGVEANVVRVEPLDWPTKLQILVDNGIGLGGGNIMSVSNGLRGLLDALGAGIEVTLVATAPQPRFLVRGTTDREAMTKGLGLLTSDSGAGHFAESLNEATQRIERDKGNFFPTIIALATTSGDMRVLDRDVEQTIRRLQQRPTTVHVVLYSGGGPSFTGGANQTQVGLAVTEMTKGRYENINSATRIASLLPELGALVARNHERESHQFRITIERPAGAKGPLGKVKMGAGGSLNVNSLSFDGRIP